MTISKSTGTGPPVDFLANQWHGKPMTVAKSTGSLLLIFWRTNDTAHQWHGGPMTRRTNDMADQWHGGPMTCDHLKDIHDNVSQPTSNFFLNSCRSRQSCWLNWRENTLIRDWGIQNRSLILSPHGATPLGSCRLCDNLAIVSTTFLR